MDNKLSVFSLIGASVNGISRVTVDSVSFGLMAGRTPAIPFIAREDGGKEVREFKIDGATVYHYYDRAKRMSSFFMATEEAQKRLVIADATPVSIGLASFLAAPDYAQAA